MNNENLNKQNNVANGNSLNIEQQMLQGAIQLHQQNQLPEAEALYRQILATNPLEPKALHFLGLIAFQTGQNDVAEKLVSQSIKLQSNDSEAHFNLGNIYQVQKRYVEAEQSFQQALKYDPNNSNIYAAIGAIYAIRESWEQVIECYKNAVSLKPKNAKFLLNLADAYRQINNLAEAEKLYHQAIKLNPTFLEAYFNLGYLYQEQHLGDHAITTYLAAIELNPKLVAAWMNIALIYTERGQLTEALESINKSIAIDPNGVDALVALGNIKKDQGFMVEALAAYRHALSLQNGNSKIGGDYLFVMHYDSSITPLEIYEETLAWGMRHADPIAHLEHHNDRNPARRLRIGYVSGDFRQHAVIYYLEPVLQSHDKSQVEIFCYANQARSDDVTTRLKSYADHWRDIFRLSDKAAADLIQKDKIDILIDLSGHTAGNRLLVFAYKPAPIQATWIGYFNTTGVKAIDYIITDCFLLPPGEEDMYVEKPLRLPNSIVYKVHDLPITVNALPALTNSYVTFGCFNNLSKITPEVIELWAQILRKIPSAKLYLKNKSFGDVATCDLYRAQFTALGVVADRLRFSGISPLPEYLEAYNDVDLCLDPFPYNGATTTRDSLWMGVPMVALKGDRLAGRSAESMLSVVGLEEFIAATKEEYIEKAIAFANNIPRLVEVRNTLRQTLIAAPLTNPRLFTRGLEQAFRDIWKQWCQKQ